MFKHLFSTNRNQILCYAALSLTLSAIGNAQAVRTGFTTAGTLARGDDTYSAAQAIGFPVNFYGTTFTNAYVSMNGYITFDGGKADFTPEGLRNNPRKIIAPFFADVDTTNTQTSPVTWGRGTVNGRNAFAVNWVNVGYYDARADKLNSFQLVMIDRSDRRSGDFDFEFNYNNIRWEAGEADDGVAGLCTSASCVPASAGYSNGLTGASNVSSQVNGSLTRGAFLDSNTSTGLRFQQAGGSGVAGRLLFQVVNGTVVQGPTITSLSPPSVNAGSPAFPLTINGANFITGSIVRWTNSANQVTNLTPTSITPTQVVVTVPATLVATAGNYQVAVVYTSESVTSNSATFVVNAATPVINSLNPPSTLAGSPAFNLTINGANFATGATVRWTNPSNQTTTLAPTTITATSIAVNIPANLVASAGTNQVVVTVGSLNSNAASFTVNPATPVINSLAPPSVQAGSAAFSLTINGANFATGATVRWTNPSNQATTLTPTNVSANSIAVNIPAALVATAGNNQVAVLVGSATSNSVTFTVGTATPIINSLSPPSVQAGSAAFSLTIAGSNFANGATVRWTNASNQATTLTPSSITATSIAVSIPANLVATAGTNQVAVVSGSTTSNSVAFDVTTAPVPTITSLSPPSVTVGSAAFTLTVNGSNFATGATVRWTNPANQATTLTPTSITATAIAVSIPAALVASAGTNQVAVVLGSTTSNSVAFAVNPTASPTITALSPTSVTAGAAQFNLTITGSNFATGATVRWTNSANQATTLTPSSISATSIGVAVPAALVATAGSNQVAVVLASGPVSNAQTFTVNPITAPGMTLTASTATNPTDQPTLSLAVNPAPATALTGTLTLSFAPNGVANLPAGYIDPAAVFASSGSTTLNFTIPAGSTSVTLPNNGQFSKGTVAGTLTARVTALNAGTVSVLPNNPASTPVTLDRLSPSITNGSVRILNATASGLTVEVQGYTTTRELTSATFTFIAANGSDVTGGPFTVNIAQPAQAWFDGATGRSNGSRFSMQMPFTLTGDPNAIGSVTVVLANSVGSSTSVTGGR